MAKFLIFLSVFLTPLIFSLSTRELFEFPKMLFVYLTAILLLASHLFFPTKTNKIGPDALFLLKALIFFLLISLVSSVLSINTATSLFGYYTRFNGGLLSLLAYLAFFYFSLSGLTPTDVKQAGRLLSLGALAISGYAILQHLGIDKDFWVQDSQARAFSTLGQPNWLAAYLLMVFPLCLHYLISAVTSKAKLFYFLTSLAVFSGIWFTYSLSGVLGLLFLCFILPLLLDKKVLKARYKLLIALALGCLLIVLLRPGLFLPKLRSLPKILTEKMETRASEASPAEAKGIDTSLIRLIVWRGSVKLLLSSPKVFTIGTGPETFAYSFLKFRPVELNKTTEWDFLYNKAHNYYLDLLTGTGMLGLFAFTLFVLGTVRLFVRYKKKGGLAAALLSGWLSLLVTNFFGWPTVSTSLLFFLFPTFIVIIGQTEKAPTEGQRSSSKRVGIKALSIVLLLGGIGLILSFLLADTNFASALSLSRRNYFKEANFRFSRSVRLNPTEPTYRREYAASLAQETLGFEDEQKILSNTVEAVVQAETAFNLNPYNSLTLKSLLRTYFILAKLEPTFEQDVVKYAKRIMALSPTEPRAFYDTSLILSYLEKRDAALNFARQALELKPGYAEAEDLIRQLEFTKETKKPTELP